MMRAFAAALAITVGCATPAHDGLADANPTEDASVSAGPDGGFNAPLEDTDGPCTPVRPISIGGDVFGYPDNNSVNTAIGVNLLDANQRNVDHNGALCSVAANNCNGASNYAFFLKTNPTVGVLGVPETTPGTTRRWSRCVSPKVTAMYLEGYPRTTSGSTDVTKYAETMSNRVEVTGATVRYAMRFPIRFEYDAAQGDTGNANGFGRCHGVGTQLTRINAWSRDPSTACGIRAYQSGGALNSNGYWLLGPLAAGQCGASSQTVGIVAHVVCDGTAMTKTIDVEILRGQTIGAVNFEFP